MKTSRAAVILTAAVVMVGVKSSFALSDPVSINTSQSQDRRWKTVFTSEVPLQWGWHEDATSAQLEIAGMNSTFATNFTAVTSNYLWRAFSGSTPSAEDVYDLTLTFYDSESAAVESQSAQLAVVKGALGNTKVITTSDDTPWPKLHGNAVIPYDAGWSAATASATASQLEIAKEDGATQTYALADTAGYFGWEVIGSGLGTGAFNLALSFPGTQGEWSGTLVRPDSTLIIVR